MICSDPAWGTSPLQHQNEDKNKDWRKVAFFLTVTDHKVLQKIGLENVTGGTFYIGEFAIYSAFTK